MRRSGLVLGGVGAVSLVCGSADASIANSRDDWDLAVNDGIGVGGGMVVAGSLDDAAQQGHSDGSGSGTWRYGFGNSGDGGAFSGGFPLLDTWYGTGWGRAGQGFPSISAGGQAPLSGSITSDPMSYRRWTSNGSFSGEVLTMQIKVTLSNELSDGVTLVVSSSGTVDDYSVLLPPETFNQEQVFTLDFVDGVDTWALAGIRPNGVGLPGVGDFFNDSVRIEMSILPSPSTAALLGLGGLAAARRRR